MIDRLKRSAPVAILVLCLGIMAACGEQVSGSLGCPQLCTDESASLRDTVLLGAVVVDTTIFGYPGLGEVRDITLLNQGDTADVRMVVRFDSVPKRFFPAGSTTDAPITKVDSASLSFFIDTLTVKPTSPITVEAFDVDTTALDTLRSALVPLFRADRLLGSKTFQASDIKDTLKVPLDNEKVFAKIRDTLRLRIGVRVSSSSGTARMRVLGSSVGPRVRFRVSPDTLVKPDTVFLTSRTPVENSFTASALVMFPVVAKGLQTDPPQGRIAIGGLAGARAFLRFSIPPAVLDSVQVIRASLLLNQLPARSTGRVSDILTVFTHPVLSSPVVTDIRTAITFIGSPFTYGIDSVRFAANDTGTKSIELVNLLRFWRAVGDSNSTRAIVLRAGEEGNTPGELNFSSLEAAAALRPRLRLTYVPRRGFGLP